LGAIAEELIRYARLRSRKRLGGHRLGTRLSRARQFQGKGARSGRVMLQRRRCPKMLSLISLADTPAPTVVSPMRARSRRGTLACAHTPVPRSLALELAGPTKASAQPVAAKAFARPQARIADQFFGNGAQAAGLAKLPGQPISKVNYAHTTRIAALKGSGALGPHPARDPV